MHKPTKMLTFKLHAGCLTRAYFRQLACSDCYRLFIFFTYILKIIVILFVSYKISRIFVKEITTKTNQNVLKIYSKRYVNEVNR